MSVITKQFGKNIKLVVNPTNNNAADITLTIDAGNSDTINLSSGGGGGTVGPTGPQGPQGVPGTPGASDHLLLTNIGTNTHATIDTALTRLANTSGTNTGDQTNITGNAATVTTNADLTGQVTSVGNTTTVTNASVIAKVLTGYSSGSGLVASADTILQAVNKLNGNSVSLNSSYRTILSAYGSHIAAKVAGTYGMAAGDPLAVSGTGTLYPICLIHIVGADFPSIGTITTVMRIRAQISTNAVAPTGNFTFGLFPVTSPGSAGGAGLVIHTLGTVVSGSNGATFTTPAANSTLTAVGSDFAIPTDGVYCIGVVTTATIATSAHVHLNAQLQVRNA